jgi:DNA polymerase elongation subunit (family B)
MRRVLWGIPNESLFLAWFTEQLHKFVPYPPEVECFVTTVEINTTYKTDAVPAVTLCRILSQETGSAPRPGTRVGFIVPYTGTNKKLYEVVVPAGTFVRDRMMLDVVYYLDKQLGSSLDQALSQHPSLHAKLRALIRSYTADIQRVQQGYKVLDRMGRYSS